MSIAPLCTRTRGTNTVLRAGRIWQTDRDLTVPDTRRKAMDESDRLDMIRRHNYYRRIALKRYNEEKADCVKDGIEWEDEVPSQWAWYFWPLVGLGLFGILLVGVQIGIWIAKA